MVPVDLYSMFWCIGLTIYYKINSLKLFCIKYILKTSSQHKFYDQGLFCGVSFFYSVEIHLLWRSNIITSLWFTVRHIKLWNRKTTIRAISCIVWTLVKNKLVKWNWSVYTAQMLCFIFKVYYFSLCSNVVASQGLCKYKVTSWDALLLNSWKT